MVARRKKDETTQERQTNKSFVFVVLLWACLVFFRHLQWFQQKRVHCLDWFRFQTMSSREASHRSSWSSLSQPGKRDGFGRDRHFVIYISPLHNVISCHPHPFIQPSAGSKHNWLIGGRWQAFSIHDQATIDGFGMRPFPTMTRLCQTRLCILELPTGWSNQMRTELRKQRG